MKSGHPWLLPLMLVGLAGNAAIAQRGRNAPGSAPSPGPGWLPRESNLDNPVFAGSFTAAERATAIARLEAIEAVFRKAAALARPEGFEVGGRLTWMQFGRSIAADNGKDLISYEYRLRFWSPSFAFDPEIIQRIVITVNSYSDINAGLWYPIAKDGGTEEGRMYTERPSIAPPPGMPAGTIIYDRLEAARPSFTQVLLMRPGELPWVPVSWERYLKAELATYTDADREVAQSFAQTTYQRWVSDSAARRKLHEQVPAAARKALEETDRAVGERLKVQETSEREFARKLNATPSPADQIRARLASMSPAERSAPAWIDPAGSGPAPVSPDAPGARRLVALNPAFYRATGSRVAVRLINVYFQQDVPNEHNNWAGVDRAIYDVYRTLDWQALARVLDP